MSTESFQEFATHVFALPTRNWQQKLDLLAAKVDALVDEAYRQGFADAGALPDTHFTKTLDEFMKDNEEVLRRLDD